MVDEFNLDFKELKSRDKAGYAFQALIAEIGRGLGYSVEEGGPGADGGRDLFFDIAYEGLKLKRETRRWLVSCKDFSESEKAVGRNDLAGIYDDAIGKKCYGILLACSTNASNSSVTLLGSFETVGVPIQTHVWNKHNIQQILHENEQNFRFLLARYFPKSYGYQSQKSGSVETVLISILDDVDTAEAIAYATRIAGSDEDPLLLWRVADAVLKKKPSLAELFDLLKIWASIEHDGFKDAIVASLIEYFYEQSEYVCEMGDVLSEEAPSFCGSSSGSTEFEITQIAFSSTENVVTLKCSGYAEVEYTDSVDKDTGRMSLSASLSVEITALGYELTDPEMEDPAYQDYLAEREMDSVRPDV